MLALAEHVSIAIGRARLYAEVRANEARFRGAFDQAPIGMALVGTDGRWLRVNRALCAMLGYAEADLLATTFQAVTHPDDLTLDLEQVRRLLVGDVDTYAIEKRFVHRQGHVIWAQLNASLVRDDEGRPRYLVSQIQDITERKTFEERLEHLALHDPLTGLPNRVLFADRLERALAAPRGRGAGPAVLFVDLDRFKLVNDTLGHESGDRLLAAVAARLAGVLRPVDTIARLGGDEFAVLLDGATAAAAGRAAERVIEALRPPFVVDGRETFVSASVGIALGRGRGQGRVAAVPPRPQDVLREADIALYQAKAAGRGTYARFDPRMAPVVVSGFEQDVALRRAVEREEFCLHWQPQVALATGAVVGLEALVRWQHPDQGLLPPDRFIGLAEETGLIVPLGRWALREACRQAQCWAERHPETAALTVSVNLSTRQFRRAALAAEVAAALEESGLDRRRLELEITESVVVEDDAEVERTLAALRRLGVRLAIDDFGTGYSSLRYLHRLAVDALKLDQGFVAGLGTDAVSVAIVRAVTTLAHELGMTLVAEGIETAAQLALLRELGVDHGQGFYFSRPLSVAEVDAFLRDVPHPAFDRLVEELRPAPPPDVVAAG
jgi:diguanylate cyclase (GGDEF)-like protein/PAS domain S-box-containing protein